MIYVACLSFYSTVQALQFLQPSADNLQNGSFQVVKRAILECRTARFAFQYGPFRKAEWCVMNLFYKMLRFDCCSQLRSGAVGRSHRRRFLRIQSSWARSVASDVQCSLIGVMRLSLGHVRVFHTA